MTIRGKMFNGLRLTLLGGCIFLLLGSCSSADYDVIHPPNYDNIIGTKFSDSVYKGRMVYKVIKATNTIEELENRRSDGCILVFGVRKSDDIIEYWRVDSGAGTCLVRKKPLNR